MSMKTAICRLIDMGAHFFAVPEELRSLPRWVGFLATLGKNGKKTKKPGDPQTLYGASSTDPQTWGTFEQALSVVGRQCRVGQDNGTVSGIGFVLAPPYCGIDIDHCIDTETGEIHSKALEIVTKMDSYTEYSPSGTGLHIIYKGKAHGDWKRKKADALGEGIDLEMYQQGRYFTVTGNIFGDAKTVQYRDNEAETVHNRFMQVKTSNTQSTVKKPALSMPDDDILDLARNSRNGMLFSELYAGTWQGHYGSQSEADMALCSMLAFWFRKDAGRIDSAFRRSGLMREKWDRKTGGSTYGEITVSNAINRCTDVYDPQMQVKSNYSISITGSGKPLKVYTMDDTGNAQRLKDMFGDRIRYNYNDKKWLIYDGCKWSTDITGIIWTLIDMCSESMKKERSYYENYDAENGTDMLKQFDKYVKKCRSNNAKRALEKEEQHHTAITPSALDRHREKLNTPAGIVDLQSFEVTPNDPKAFFTKAAGAKYSPDAQCPQWEKFINDIMGGDRELIHYVQKAAGYSLSGFTDEQCAFFCYGTGRNGKTTFLDVIRCIAGDYASNIQPETLMVRNASSAANSDIARLKGARFVTSVEPNEGMRLNEGLLKQITGDDMITARKLYGDEFEFRPEFKLWMATNHKPMIRGTDTGIWRRIHLIPFTVQIPEERIDRKLKDKLMKEAEGILAWCLRGLDAYNREGLKKPAAVINAIDAYRTEMDVISRFLDECTLFSPCRCVKAKELYDVYSRWCESNGEYKLTNTKFGVVITKKFEKKKMTGGWYYSGLDFSDEYRPINISIKE